jgi:hypothetical protein
MVQKIQSRGVIWVQSNRPQAGHLSQNENDDLAVQYKDVHALVYTGRCGLKINNFSN